MGFLDGDRNGRPIRHVIFCSTQIPRSKSYRMLMALVHNVRLHSCKTASPYHDIFTQNILVPHHTIKNSLIVVVVLVDLLVKALEAGSPLLNINTTLQNTITTRHPISTFLLGLRHLLILVRVILFSDMFSAFLL